MVVIPLISFPSLRLWFFFLLSSLLLLNPLAVSGLVNVTVERGDPQIAYGPKFDAEWREAWPGVMKSSDPRAAATFTFTGTRDFTAAVHIHHPQLDRDRLPSRIES